MSKRKTGYPAGCGILRHTSDLTDQLKVIEREVDDMQTRLDAGGLDAGELQAMQDALQEKLMAVESFPPFRGLVGVKARVMEKINRLCNSLASQ